MRFIITFFLIFSLLSFSFSSFLCSLSFFLNKPVNGDLCHRNVLKYRDVIFLSYLSTSTRFLRGHDCDTGIKNIYLLIYLLKKRVCGLYSQRAVALGVCHLSQQNLLSVCLPPTQSNDLPVTQLPLQKTKQTNKQINISVRSSDYGKSDNHN